MENVLMCGCEDWMTCEHPWPILVRLPGPGFRHVPGIPFTPNGIAATIDANALRSVYYDVLGREASDDECDTFARQRFAELEAESQKT